MHQHSPVSLNHSNRCSFFVHAVIPSAVSPLPFSSGFIWWKVEGLQDPWPPPDPSCSLFPTIPFPLSKAKFSTCLPSRANRFTLCGDYCLVTRVVTWLDSTTKKKGCNGGWGSHLFEEKYKFFCPFSGSHVKTVFLPPPLTQQSSLLILILILISWDSCWGKRKQRKQYCTLVEKSNTCTTWKNAPTHYFIKSALNVCNNSLSDIISW